jgi:hypothetical protein
LKVVRIKAGGKKFMDGQKVLQELDLLFDFV